MDYPSDGSYTELRTKIREILFDTRLTDFAKVNAIGKLVLTGQERLS